ncbi:MAG: hypothetical protein M3332_13480 [Actinomycetota bacterium]|nr:hypothetical protein [Actinomycetota bacterium]
MLDGLHPEPQYWIEDSYGRLARADLAFHEHKVAVEYDGSWRDDELWALNRDRDLPNRVQAAGWEIVFVTAQLLNDPARMVEHSPRRTRSTTPVSAICSEWRFPGMRDRDSAPNGERGLAEGEVEGTGEADLA